MTVRFVIRKMEVGHPPPAQTASTIIRAPPAIAPAFTPTAGKDSTRKLAMETTPTASKRSGGTDPA